jgi:hypothetical protein
MIVFCFASAIAVSMIAGFMLEQLGFERYVKAVPAVIVIPETVW